MKIEEILEVNESVLQEIDTFGWHMEEARPGLIGELKAAKRDMVKGFYNGKAVIIWRERGVK